MSASAVPECVLARLWQEGRHARELRTTAGQRVGVVYRGVWTYSAGPDFRDALLDIDGVLVRGAVELHVDGGDWERHGHHLDPAYDAVVLHVVLRDNPARPARTSTGCEPPTIVLTDFLPAPVEELVGPSALVELGLLGARTCLPTLAGGRPELVREALRRAGWKRLTSKQLRVQQEFECAPPAEVLYRALLDGLGLSRNRRGMALLAQALPLVTLEAAVARHGLAGAQAALLGVAGFLPIAPAHQALAELSVVAAVESGELFEALAAAHGLRPVEAGAWQLTRVRPFNHPARRLASFASLIADCPNGLLAAVVARAGFDARVWRNWFAATTPSIGRSRADQIAVNVVAPFLAAYADANGDDDLRDAVARLWETFPGTVDDGIAAATLRQIAGAQPFRIALGIEAQGLHHIGRHGCAVLRCFECPIAELAVRFEPGAA